MNICKNKGSYGHTWTASKCLPCCWWADGPASVDHCSGGCPCSFHCQDPPGDTCKLYYVLNGLLVLTWIQNHHVAEIKSNRLILISLNFTTDVTQHHKTGDHETHQRTTEPGLTEDGGRLVTRENDFFATYLVWWDVHVNVTQAAVSGETVLTNFNRSRRRNQTVDTGGVPLSENAEQMTAVVTNLLVLR